MEERENMSRQVTCITKRPYHSDPYTRIQAIGGAGWHRSEDDAIRDVERDASSYYVSAGGKSVWVIVATHNSRKYLKTQTDNYTPDNLLALPEFP
jgi:hypothetical protein